MSKINGSKHDRNGGWLIPAIFFALGAYFLYAYLSVNGIYGLLLL
jgi:hypothetical protein